MDQINSTLTSLRLSGMAQCWKTLAETHKLNELSLADGMEILLQAERDQRSANRYARLDIPVILTPHSGDIDPS